jgi:hypothetical protein
MFLRQRQYTYVNYSSNHLMWSQLMLLFGSNDQSDQVQWLISTFLMYHFICLICYYLVNVISFTQSRSDHNKRRLLYEKNNSMIVCIRKKNNSLSKYNIVGIWWHLFSNWFHRKMFKRTIKMYNQQMFKNVIISSVHQIHQRMS